MNRFIAGIDFTCIVFLAVVLISVIMLKKRERKYIYYLISLVSLMIFCLCDSIAYIMDDVGGNELLHFYMNYFSFIGVDIVLPSFGLYVFDKIKETTNISRIHVIIVLSICVLDVIFLTYGAISGSLFRIVGDEYVYGELINYVGISQVLVSVYFIVLVSILRSKLDRKFKNTMLFYFLLPILSILVEIFNPSITLTYLVSSIIIFTVYLVVVSEDLRIKTISEKIMYEASITDNLTGLLNRRAYTDTILDFKNTYPNNFVFMSLDINGLKKINDTIGHNAGDELIVGASTCMKRSLGLYGNIYRIGGDEFIALLDIDDKIFNDVIDNFEKEVMSWKGKTIDKLNISFGYVKSNEMSGLTIHDISIMADRRMYESKSAFYKRVGVDRRGQYEAHVALYSLYTKILKINLTTDSYEIINMDDYEEGLSNSISKWLYMFGVSGNVCEDDVDSYLAQTNIEYLKEYFKQGKNIISIFYKRKYNDEFKEVVMDIIPTSSYTNDNQELFLYVKSIDK